MSSKEKPGIEGAATGSQWGGTTKLQFPEMMQKNLSRVLRLPPMSRFYLEPIFPKKKRKMTPGTALAISS